jgi:hypothetical protein
MIYGATFLSQHITLLRGSAMAGKDPVVTPGHLVAHELSHISLNSSDEHLAEKQALRWINQSHIVSTKELQCLSTYATKQQTP